jgi:hypothetical protein
MRFLYQVSSWGPDGEDDVNYVVQAESFTEAAKLVDVELASSDVRKKCRGFSNNVIELGQSLAGEAGVLVVIGPYLALSGARGGFRVWSRNQRGDDWDNWSSETRSR